MRKGQSLRKKQNRERERERERERNKHARERKKERKKERKTGRTKRKNMWAEEIKTNDKENCFRAVRYFRRGGEGLGFARDLCLIIGLSPWQQKQ